MSILIGAALVLVGGYTIYSRQTTNAQIDQVVDRAIKQDRKTRKRKKDSEYRDTLVEQAASQAEVLYKKTELEDGEEPPKKVKRPPKKAPPKGQAKKADASLPDGVVAVPSKPPANK